MDADLQLFQHVFESYLSNRRAAALREGLPEVVKLITSRGLLNRLFEVEKLSLAYPKLLDQWCNILTQLLLPLEDGNVKEDYGTNVFVSTQLLLLTVKQSGKAFVFGVQNWARELLKCLSRVYLGPEVLESVIQTLSEVVQLTKSHPTLEREVTSFILPQFNTQLLSLIEEHNLNSLVVFDTLYWSLRTFPKPFRPLTSRFRTILLDSWLSNSPQRSFLRATSSQLLAQKVFQCLVQLVTTERNSSMVAEAYYTSFSSLVATGHSLLNTLLASVEDEPHPNVTNSYPFKQADLTIDKSSFYGLRFQTCLSRYLLTCHAIVCFLDFRPTQFIETPLSIPIQELTKLICRVYCCNNATSKPVNNSHPKNFVGLLSILPTLYSATHDLLIKLSQCLGSGALELCQLISKIFQKLFYFSENYPVERHSTYCLIYHVVDGLGETVLYHSLDTILGKVLDDLALQDSVPEKVVINSASSSKKKRNHGSVQDSIQTGSSSTFLPRSNYVIALNVLNSCLRLSRFPPREDLRMKLFSLLFRHVSLNISGELHLNPSQLLTLSRCLLTVTLQPSPTQGILAETGMSIFSSLLNHPSIELRLMARQSLAQLDTLIHPQLPHVLIDKQLYSEVVIKSYRELTAAPSLPATSPVSISPEVTPVDVLPPHSAPSAPSEPETLTSAPVPELKRPHIDPLPSPKRSHIEPELVSQSIPIPLLAPDVPASEPAVEFMTKSITEPVIKPVPTLSGPSIPPPSTHQEDSDSDDEIPTIVA